jgi:hypothetical protein
MLSSGDFRGEVGESTLRILVSTYQATRHNYCIYIYTFKWFDYMVFCRFQVSVTADMFLFVNLH